MPHPDGPAAPAPGRSSAGGESSLPALVARLTDEDLERGPRSRLLAAVAVALLRGARTAGVTAVASGRWLAEVVEQVAPHLPIRDRAALHTQLPGRSAEELADHLVRTASRTTAAIGAAGGALASVEYLAPPTLLTSPLQLSAETLAVVAVEVKLLAELQEVYGQPVRGDLTERATAYLTAWARSRGVSASSGRGLSAVLGTGARRQLQRRILRRLGRNMSTLGPLLSGAVAGAELNRRATLAFGEAVRRDLRRTGPYS